MKPRSRLLAAALVLALLLAGGAWAVLRGGAGAPRPHIVLIVWDTCRGDRVQVNGYSLPTTPNLLRLASEGQTFRQCYTPSPWTPPSHASLFTGLLPRNHGLRERMGDHVFPGIPLLAETLRDAGYETVCVSANSQISTVTGLARGFGRRIECFESKAPGAVGMDVGERVLEWLAERKRGGSGKPVFLFVNLMDTHVPYAFEAAEVAAVRGPAAVEGAGKAAEFVKEVVVMSHMAGVQRLDPAIIHDLDAAYDGAVRVADRTTGRILDRLRADGLMDNSVVVVCADHGENLGEHGLLGHTHSLSENVLRVPLVVRWPGRFPAGGVEDGQVRLQDVYPTLLEAARVKVPPKCGTDAVTLLEDPLRSRMALVSFGPSTDRALGLGDSVDRAPREMVEQLYRAYIAVREPSDRPGARKYVSVTRTTVGGPSTSVREELFDLAADPGEDRNLLGDGADPKEWETAGRLRILGGR